MDSFIIPASNDEIAIISIGGNGSRCVSLEEMEGIRNWVDASGGLPDKEDLSRVFGYIFDIKVWTANCNPDRELVWLIEGYLSYDDEETLKVFQDIFKAADEPHTDPFIIFVAEPTSIKRINKALLPFL